MSLIGFHKVLIGTAIAFCLGFAVWELLAYRATGDPVAGLVGAGFAVLALSLVYYIRHLSHFLGLDRPASELPEPVDSFSSNGNNRVDSQKNHGNEDTNQPLTF